jgi:excisionase family DNA binding protein
MIPARQRLAVLLAPETLEALEDFVSEFVAAKLAEVEINGRGTPWLSIPDAAAYLGVSERTIEREIARGQLQSSSLGRRRLLRRETVDAYLQAAGEE